jgi:beta-galactosidase
MLKWTRRRILKAGLLASASVALPEAATARSSPGGDEWPGSFDEPPVSVVRPQDAETRVFSNRERFLMDFGWRFHLGHANDPEQDFDFGGERQFAKVGQFFTPSSASFDDSGWRPVDLPHDWAVELPFENAKSLTQYGSKPLGRAYPETSIGWYRRTFELPASDAGRRVSIEFGGVFRDCIVAVNGHFLGRNLSGYASFRFDFSDVAHYGGKNIVVVRADATENEGWFYEGAGIYRHVWMVKTHPLHVVHLGTSVTSEVRTREAALSLLTEVENESSAEQVCQVRSNIVSPNGLVVASTTSEPIRIPPGGCQSFPQQAIISQPALWSIESPRLYRLATTITADATEVDQYETPFGIRTIRFDPDHGFFLNGSRLELKGTCNHQDHAGVGVALPDRLQSYRIEKLKAMGSNAYRTSHNPPTPELLDACDRLGMLVLDETRMFSSNQEGLSQLERMIRRDRNHPSIFCWSVANEEWAVQGKVSGQRIAESMRKLARRLDISRPVTAATDSGYSDGEGITRSVDVQGFNYQREDLDAFHRNFPTRPTMGTECGSSYATRGIYGNDEVKGYVSAYDVNCPDYGATAEQWWSFFAERQFLAGGFLWTGFDYRGEPSPYSWPCVGSHFGALDTCGFAKDNYFYYQAWWGSQQVLHLFPHWNWEGKEGHEIDVWCHSNLDSVELFLNGTSLGSKNVGRNSHAEWKARYAPGVLEARGWKDGKVVLTARRETTNAPAKIVLRPDRLEIAADGEDLSIIAAEVVDIHDRIVPTASNAISFEIAGPGRLIGVGNGDPSCHEADQSLKSTEGKRSAFNGMCMALVQSLKQPGSIHVSASSAGLQRVSVVVDAVPAKLRTAVI